MLSRKTTVFYRFRRLISIFLLISFTLFNTISNPYPLGAEPVPEHDPLNPKNFSLPENLGTIREKYIPEGKHPDKFVIYLESAHRNLDSEENTRKIIQYFEKEYGLSLVLLEGGEGKLDSLFFRSFPDGEKKEKLLNEYLQAGDLSGAEIASILEEASHVQYHGIESQSIYDQNKAAFLNAIRRQPEILELLRKRKANLDQKSKKILQEKSMVFKTNSEGFREERLDFLTYLKSLNVLYPSPNRFEAKFPELQKLLSAEQNEETLEKDESLPLAMNRMIRGFQSRVGPKLSREEKLEVNGLIQDYRTGRMDGGVLIQKIHELSVQAGFEFNLPKVLQAPLSHSRTLLSIKGTEVFEELSVLERELRQILPVNEDERALLRDYEFLDLLNDFAELELLPKDWGRLQKDLIGAELRPLFEHHFEFYELAEKRNEILAQNALKMIGRNHQGPAFLSTGGFHAKGISEILKAEKIPFVLISPAINHMTGKELYLNAMQGERSFMKYFKGSLWDALARDYAAKLVSSLREEELGPSLKRWRDQIIQNAIAEGRITQAAQYTKYVDALAKTPGKKQKFEESLVKHKLDIFASGLSDLWKRGGITPKSVGDLIQRMNQAVLKSNIDVELALVRRGIPRAVNMLRGIQPAGKAKRRSEAREDEESLKVLEELDYIIDFKAGFPPHPALYLDQETKPVDLPDLIHLFEPNIESDEDEPEFWRSIRMNRTVFLAHLHVAVLRLKHFNPLFELTDRVEIKLQYRKKLVDVVMNGKSLYTILREDARSVHRFGKKKIYGYELKTVSTIAQASLFLRPALRRKIAPLHPKDYFTLLPDELRTRAEARSEEKEIDREYRRLIVENRLSELIHLVQEKKEKPFSDLQDEEGSKLLDLLQPISNPRLPDAVSLVETFQLSNRSRKALRTILQTLDSVREGESAPEFFSWRGLINVRKQREIKKSVEDSLIGASYAQNKVHARVRLSKLALESLVFAIFVLQEQIDSEPPWMKDEALKQDALAFLAQLKSKAVGLMRAESVKRAREPVQPGAQSQLPPDDGQTEGVRVTNGEIASEIDAVLKLIYEVGLNQRFEIPIVDFLNDAKKQLLGRTPSVEEASLLINQAMEMFLRESIDSPAYREAAFGIQVLDVIARERNFLGIVLVLISWLDNAFDKYGRIGADLHGKTRSKLERAKEYAGSTIEQGESLFDEDEPFPDEEEELSDDDKRKEVMAIVKEIKGDIRRMLIDHFFPQGYTELQIEEALATDGRLEFDWGLYRGQLLHRAWRIFKQIEREDMRENRRLRRTRRNGGESRARSETRQTPAKKGTGVYKALVHAWALFDHTSPPGANPAYDAAEADLAARYGYRILPAVYEGLVFQDKEPDPLQRTINWVFDELTSDMVLIRDPQDQKVVKREAMAFLRELTSETYGKGYELVLADRGPGFADEDGNGVPDLLRLVQFGEGYKGSHGHHQGTSFSVQKADEIEIVSNGWQWEKGKQPFHVHEDLGHEAGSGKKILRPLHWIGTQKKLDRVEGVPNGTFIVLRVWEHFPAYPPSTLPDLDGWFRELRQRARAEARDEEPEFMPVVLGTSEDVRTKLQSLKPPIGKQFVLRMIPSTTKQKKELDELLFVPVDWKNDIYHELQALFLQGHVQSVGFSDDVLTISFHPEASFAGIDALRHIHLVLGTGLAFDDLRSAKFKQLLQDPATYRQAPHVASLISYLRSGKLVLVERPYVIQKDEDRDLIADEFGFSKDHLLSEVSYQNRLNEMKAEEARLASNQLKSSQQTSQPEEAALEEIRRQRRQARKARRHERTDERKMAEDPGAYKETIVSLGVANNLDHAVDIIFEHVMANEREESSLLMAAMTKEDFIQNGYRPDVVNVVGVPYPIKQVPAENLRGIIRLQASTWFATVSSKGKVTEPSEALMKNIRLQIIIERILEQNVENTQEPRIKTHYILLPLGPKETPLIPPRPKFSGGPEKKEIHLERPFALQAYRVMKDIPYVTPDEKPGKLTFLMGAKKGGKYQVVDAGLVDRFIKQINPVISINHWKYRIKPDRVEILDANNNDFMVVYGDEFKEPFKYYLHWVLLVTTAISANIQIESQAIPFLDSIPSPIADFTSKEVLVHFPKVNGVNMPESTTTIKFPNAVSFYLAKWFGLPAYRANSSLIADESKNYLEFSAPFFAKLAYAIDLSRKANLPIYEFPSMSDILVRLKTAARSETRADKDLLISGIRWQLLSMITKLFSRGETAVFAKRIAVIDDLKGDSPLVEVYLTEEFAKEASGPAYQLSFRVPSFNEQRIDGGKLVPDDDQTAALYAVISEILGGNLADSKRNYGPEIARLLDLLSTMISDTFLRLALKSDLVPGEKGGEFYLFITAVLKMDTNGRRFKALSDPEKRVVVKFLKGHDGALTPEGKISDKGWNLLASIREMFAGLQEAGLFESEVQQLYSMYTRIRAGETNPAGFTTSVAKPPEGTSSALTEEAVFVRNLQRLTVGQKVDEDTLLANAPPGTTKESLHAFLRRLGFEQKKGWFSKGQWVKSRSEARSGGVQPDDEIDFKARDAIRFAGRINQWMARYKKIHAVEFDISGRHGRIDLGSKMIDLSTHQGLGSELFLNSKTAPLNALLFNAFNSKQTLIIGLAHEAGDRKTIRIKSESAVPASRKDPKTINPYASPGPYEDDASEDVAPEQVPVETWNWQAAPTSASLKKLIGYSYRQLPKNKSIVIPERFFRAAGRPILIYLGEGGERIRIWLSQWGWRRTFKLEDIRDKKYTLRAGGGILIGRRTSQEVPPQFSRDKRLIILTDASVSRFHLRVQYLKGKEGRSLVLTDVNSTYGTWIPEDDLERLTKTRSEARKNRLQEGRKMISEGAFDAASATNQWQAEPVLKEGSPLPVHMLPIPNSDQVSLGASPLRFQQKNTTDGNDGQDRADQKSPEVKSRTEGPNNRSGEQDTGKAIQQLNQIIPLSVRENHIGGNLSPIYEKVNNNFYNNETSVTARSEARKPKKISWLSDVWAFVWNVAGKVTRRSPPPRGWENKKIAVIGASGFVGRRIYDNLRRSNPNVVGTYYQTKYPDLEALDVTDENALREFLRAHQPDVVIYMAGLAEPDRAEKDPARAQLLNAAVPEMLNRLFDGQIIYPSTDFVFDGEQAPYDVHALPHPLNRYGVSKQEGERVILKGAKNVVIRLGFVYGLGGRLQRNFVRQVVDVLESDDPNVFVRSDNEVIRHPAWKDDVSRFISELIANERAGIFHINAEESVTKYEFGRLVAKVYYDLYPERIPHSMDVDALIDQKIRILEPPPSLATILRPRDSRMVNSTIPTPLVDGLREVISSLVEHRSEARERKQVTRSTKVRPGTHVWIKGKTGVYVKGNLNGSKVIRDPYAGIEFFDEQGNRGPAQIIREFSIFGAGGPLFFASTEDINEIRRKQKMTKAKAAPASGEDVSELEAQQVRESPLEVIAGFFARPAASINEKTRLVKDLGADSLVLVELQLEVEEVFEISVPDRKAAGWKTVGDVIRSVNDRINKRSEARTSYNQSVAESEINQFVQTVIDDPDFDPEMKIDAEVFLGLPKKFDLKGAALAATGFWQKGEKTEATEVQFNAVLIRAFLNNLDQPEVRNFLGGVIVKEIGIVKNIREHPELYFLRGESADRINRLVSGLPSDPTPRFPIHSPVHEWLRYWTASWMHVEYLTMRGEINYWFKKNILRQQVLRKLLKHPNAALRSYFASHSDLVDFGKADERRLKMYFLRGFYDFISFLHTEEQKRNLKILAGLEVAVDDERKAKGIPEDPYSLFAGRTAQFMDFLVDPKYYNAQIPRRSEARGESTPLGFDAFAAQYYQRHKTLFDQAPSFETVDSFLDWYRDHKNVLPSGKAEGEFLGASYTAQVLYHAGKISKEKLQDFQRHAGAFDYAQDSSVIQSAPIFSTPEEYLEWFKANQKNLPSGKAEGEFLGAGYTILVLLHAGKISKEKLQPFQFHAAAFDYAQDSPVIQSAPSFETVDSFLDWYRDHKNVLPSGKAEGEFLGAGYTILVLLHAGKISKEKLQDFQRHASAFDYAQDSPVIQSAPSFETVDSFLDWYRDHKNVLPSGKAEGEFLGAGYTAQVLYHAGKISKEKLQPFQFHAAAFERALKERKNIEGEIRRIWSASTGTQYRTPLARLKAEFNPSNLLNLKVKTEAKPLSPSYRNLILTYAYTQYGRELIQTLSRSEARLSVGRFKKYVLPEFDLERMASGQVVLGEDGAALLGTLSPPAAVRIIRRHLKQELTEKTVPGAFSEENVNKARDLFNGIVAGIDEPTVIQHEFTQGEIQQMSDPKAVVDREIQVAIGTARKNQNVITRIIAPAEFLKSILIRLNDNDTIRMILSKGELLIINKELHEYWRYTDESATIKITSNILQVSKNRIFDSNRYENGARIVYDDTEIAAQIFTAALVLLSQKTVEWLVQHDNLARARSETELTASTALVIQMLLEAQTRLVTAQAA